MTLMFLFVIMGATDRVRRLPRHSDRLVADAYPFDQHSVTNAFLTPSADGHAVVGGWQSSSWPILVALSGANPRVAYQR